MGFVPRLIRSPRDAEEAACDWLRSVGYTDTRVTPPGVDGGVDVVGRDVVAQVKAEMNPVGRPIVQAILGIAAHLGKRAALFTLAGTTRQALDFATEADVAVFRFDLQGIPIAENTPARRLADNAFSGTMSASPFSHIKLGPAGQRLADYLGDSFLARSDTTVHGYPPADGPLTGVFPLADSSREMWQIGTETASPTDMFEGDALVVGPIGIDVRYFSGSTSSHSGETAQSAFRAVAPTRGKGEPIPLAEITLFSEGNGRTSPEFAELARRLEDLSFTDFNRWQRPLRQPLDAVEAVEMVEDVLVRVGSGIELL